MPLPSGSTPDDDELELYLLGLLSDEHAERLDEATMADDEVAVRLEVVEDDLIGRYVRGALVGETRAHFEAVYLSSPRRRERVRFAASLLRAVDRAAAGARGPVADIRTHAPTGSTSAGPRRSTCLRIASRSDFTRRAAAISAVLVAGGVWVLLHAIGSAQPRSGVGHPRETSPNTLVLMPRSTSIGPVPALVMPTGTKRVAVELRLLSYDFPQYQIGLQDPATNRIVWRSDWIAPRSSADRPSISVALPSSVLKAQSYAIDLTGRRAAGHAEVVGGYAFRIVSDPSERGTLPSQ